MVSWLWTHQEDKDEERGWGKSRREHRPCGFEDPFHPALRRPEEQSINPPGLYPVMPKVVPWTLAMAGQCLGR